MAEALNHVEPGKGALTIDAGEIKIIKASVGPMDNNAYLLVPDQGPGVLIDAAADADRLRELIDEQGEGFEVSTIVTTHQHPDHIGALKEMVEAIVAIPMAGKPDVAAIREATGVQSMPVWTGDSIGVGAASMDVIGLVGHTPGAIALVLETGEVTHLFTGDSLFPGGPGRTTTARDFAQLMDDLEARVFSVFDDDTVVHPGHGDSTTLGAERPHLAEWRARGW